MRGLIYEKRDQYCSIKSSPTYVPFQQWHTQHIDATPTPMESHGGNEFNRAKNNPQSLPSEYEKDVLAESNLVSPGVPWWYIPKQSSVTNESGGAMFKFAYYSESLLAKLKWPVWLGGGVAFFSAQPQHVSKNTHTRLYPAERAGSLFEFKLPVEL